MDIKVKRIIFIAGNILPIILSGIIYALISQNDLHLWVTYDMVIVPAYLLMFNFLFNYRGFYAWKLLAILFIELVCVIIHMAYFRFDFTSISTTIWFIILIIATTITIIGGLILYAVSRKWRKTAAKRGEQQQENNEKPKIKTASLILYCIISLAIPAAVYYLGILVVDIVGHIIWDLGFGSLEKYTGHIFIYAGFLFTAVIILLTLEIVAAIQVYTQGKSKVPLIGKLATKLLK